MSNLDIIAGGAVDSTGNPRTYRGSSTPGYELPFIPALYALFMAPVPGLSSQPSIWKYLAIRDVEIAISPSPQSMLEIDETATLVAVGSVGYNTVAQQVEKNFNPEARLNPEGYVILSDGNRYSGSEFALLSKCYSPARRQWAFCVAGSTKVGTVGAFKYLINHWADLRKTFGDSTPFSIVIRILDGDPSRCEVIYRSAIRSKTARADQRIAG